MTSSSGSAVNDSGQYHESRKSCCARGKWSGLNIFAMVVGFVVFWPVGLFLLFWILSGRDLKDLPDTIQEKWSSMFNGSTCGTRGQKHSKGENSVFDEFQQTQYDRITEIKEEIKERARRFRDFRADAKRRADENEFKEFMSSDRPRQDK